MTRERTKKEESKHPFYAGGARPRCGICGGPVLKTPKGNAIQSDLFLTGSKKRHAIVYHRDCAGQEGERLVNMAKRLNEIKRG